MLVVSLRARWDATLVMIFIKEKMFAIKIINKVIIIKVVHK